MRLVTEPNSPANDIPVTEQDRTGRLLRVWRMACSLYLQDNFQQLMKNNMLLLENIKLYSR